MPVASPFHSRTSKLCHSYRWKDWAGYYAVCSYDSHHDAEYYAFRHAAGMIDVTPLFKYEVTGPDAEAFLSRVTVKNIAKLKMDQVSYLCWCDDTGKVVDDGTVTRLDDSYFRVTAAEPTYSWFLRHARGYDVKIEDSTQKLGALAIQGPNSRATIQSVCDADLEKLKYFRHTRARFEGGFEASITRTGYTGDLGYEIWVENKDAEKLWDTLISSGRAYGLEPCGLDSLDVTRVEAGFIMNGVDYFSAHHCLVDSRKSSPYELNLGWTVHLKRDAFVGREALVREKEEGSAWKLVGLVLDWDEYESLFASYGLPPQVCTQAWRTPVPIYDSSQRQVGYATSGAWSPILKKNLALATVETPFADEGTELRMEITAEFERRSVAATVNPLPFYSPERKKA